MSNSFLSICQDFEVGSQILKINYPNYFAKMAEIRNNKKGGEEVCLNGSRN